MCCLFWDSCHLAAVRKMYLVYCSEGRSTQTIHVNERAKIKNVQNTQCQVKEVIAAIWTITCVQGIRVDGETLG